MGQFIRREPGPYRLIEAGSYTLSITTLNVPKSLLIPFANNEPLEAELWVGENPIAAFVFAHGAGAGMNHAFMERTTELLVERGIATLRFNYPYRAAGRSFPDRPNVLLPATHAAIRLMRSKCPELPLFAGGKSMGGRMTGNLVSGGIAEPITGLVFFGYPLHPAKKPSTRRADDLASANIPMLFLQGSRDKLGQLDLLTSVVGKLERATLHLVDEGDHSFNVPKRTGKSHDDVLVELADTVAAWIKAQ